MAIRCKCLITTSNEGSGAYAVRSDNDENVYIPVSIADALQLEEFEEIEVIVVKNDRNDPPWKAIRGRHLEQESV
jgi:hypothetical protein